jgi:hypothetical protein
MEQSWQFGLKCLIFQIIEFHFDARVSAFESLSALLPDSPHLSLWVDMQDLDYGRCRTGRQKRCETLAKKKDAIHWVWRGRIIGQSTRTIPKPELGLIVRSTIEKDAKDRKTNLRENRQKRILFCTAVKDLASKARTTSL